VEGKDFRQSALEYAKKFVPPAKASKAVGLIKRAVTTGLEVGLEQGLALERELQQRLFESAEAKEGISAYNARRPPACSGKSCAGRPLRPRRGCRGGKGRPPAPRPRRPTRALSGALGSMPARRGG